MGIYYAAVDNTSKEYFEPPAEYSNKSPGCFRPDNPFPGMVVMMNIYRARFEIENDMAWDCYYSKGYKNITEDVYARYLEKFPWAKDFYKSKRKDD